MTARTLPQRHPLAFGITYWGPLPGTAGMHVQWDGPGSGLYLYACNPQDARMSPPRIKAPQAARGPFATLREAERGLAAFIAAGSD